MSTSYISSMDNLNDDLQPDLLPNKFDPQTLVFSLGCRLHSKVPSKAKCSITYQMKEKRLKGHINGETTILVLRVKKIGYFMCLQTDTVACCNGHYLIPWKQEKNFHHDLVISFHAEFGDLISLSLQMGDLLVTRKEFNLTTAYSSWCCVRQNPSLYLEY